MTDAVTDRVEEESGTTVKLGYSKESFSVSQASGGFDGVLQRFYRAYGVLSRFKELMLP